MTLLAKEASKLAASPTGWLVCSGCVQLFDFDYTKAKECAAKSIKREDADPAEIEAFESVLSSAISDVIESIGSGEITISNKRYYQCPQCGAIHLKNETTLELVLAIGTMPAGGLTCSDCYTRSDSYHIYSGLLDLNVSDDLIDHMLADSDNVSKDQITKTWSYKG